MVSYNLQLRQYCQQRRNGRYQFCILVHYAHGWASDKDERSRKFFRYIYFMSKKKKFEELVLKRKQDKFPDGLENPSRLNPEYDLELSLNPYDKWQNNLDSEFLFVGQDWGNVKYFRENKGLDMDNSPTNQTLIKLIKYGTGKEITLPSFGNKNSDFFFTNAIIGIKETTKKGMSSSIKSKWLKHSIDFFLNPLIKIIQPKYIVTLGKPAYDAIATIYGLPKNQTMKSLVNTNPKIVNGVKIFSFFHCGRLGLANRGEIDQIKDWEKMRKNIGK
jgi:hypothetical protein